MIFKYELRSVAFTRPNLCLWIVILCPAFVRLTKQEVQLMLTNLRDVFTGQSRSPNIAPFHMLGIVSFLLCNSNFVFKTRRYSIFDFKNVVTLKSGSEIRSLKIICKGAELGPRFTFYCHWKWHHSIDCVWFHIKCSLATLYAKCSDLEKRVRGPSRSLEMSPCDRAHTTSYWRSIVTMALCRVVSEIFNVEKCRDLGIGVKGHSRSLKVAPFGRSCMVSY